MKQRIRIIGGRYRGKQLTFPDADGLRPTPDRVRETLFNWLMNDIRDTRCLDAFAGSGALGLEAFSRGAREVVFLEQAHHTYKHLQKTIAEFHSPNITLINTDTYKYLQKNTKPFDLIFLDPPFKTSLLEKCLPFLENLSLLKAGGLLYIESSKIIELTENYWTKLHFKQAGLVSYFLYQRKEPNKIP